MQFTATVADLQSAVSAVLPAVPSRPSLLSLSHILITVTDDRATLHGTDLTVGVTRTLSVRDATPGDALIPGKLSNDILSALPADAVVTLTVDGNHVQLRTQRNTSRLAALDPQEYPTIPDGDIALGTLPGATLLDLLNSVAYATATEDSRPVLSGINVSAENGEITAVAADGFRLALRRIAADVTPFTLLINSAMVKPLRQLCRADDVVQLYTGNLRRHLVLRSERWSLVGAIIDGTYPDARRIIPKSATSTASFDDNKELLRTLALMSLTAENSLVRVSFDDGQLRMASNDQTNHSVAQVPATTHGATLPTVGLNTRYLREAVQALGGSAAICATHANAPVVIIPAAELPGDITAASSLHVVMPMSIRG